MLVGIDIGGTKISACLGEKSGKIIATKRIATQPLKGSKEGLLATQKLVEELIQEQKIAIDDLEAVGISSPGPISTKKGMMLNPPNLPGWENAQIVSFFEKAWNKPIVMNNDANAAALAEFQFGSCKGVQNLVYLTCSTGMGGGAIANGELVQGISDTAAEVGHFVLDLNGPKCPCGQSGCFEVYCGGAALAKRMKEEIRAEKIQTLILEEAQGEIEKVDAAALVQAVKKKDPYALKIWEEYTLRLAQGVGTVLMNFNPEALILGTMAIHAQQELMVPLKKHLPKFAWKPNIESCRIEPSSIGDVQSELSGLALAIKALLSQKLMEP